MSQHTARHDQHAKADDEDVAYPSAPSAPSARGRVARGRRPVGQPDGDGGVSPDEPDEGEFELIGDDDLGEADLGPAAPGARDPDADSGRIRKIALDS
ncbi:MAG TPA: hypothetical protein VH021_10635 [Trebonia sp.]|jgi:hypothetical protein|nr:hypothetical protein [Trebonia sp.]